STDEPTPASRGPEARTVAASSAAAHDERLMKHPVLLFPHAYTCDVLDETNQAKIYYPGATRYGGRDGVIVRVNAGHARRLNGHVRVRRTHGIHGCGQHAES